MEKIKINGGKLYMVGGAVRDKLLNRLPKDYDYVVTGISKDKFLEIFPNIKSYGKSFPVFEINGDEFALARTEKKFENGHKGFKFYTNENITIDEDLKRRDITINSIAYDIEKNEYIDPYNGIGDLKDKIIKATSSAFSEDPLRVYRVAKFAARLNFKVDDDTIKMMKNQKDELETLSNSRVYGELYDALSSEFPQNFFEILRKADCLDIHFKEIADLIGVEQPILYHPEGDAYNHTMEVLERCSKKTQDVNIRFSALVHDIGKGVTPKEKWPHHIGHEKAGEEMVKKMCERLELPTSFKECGIISCREHMRASLFNEMRVSKKVDFITQNYKTRLGLKGLEIIVNSDKDRGNDEIKFADLGNEMMKTVNGKDIVNQDNYIIIKEIIRNKRIQWLKERMEY